MSSATILVGIFACILTPTASNFILPSTTCQPGAMTFQINPNSSLLGPEGTYVAEIEDTEIQHDAWCPKWRTAYKSLFSTITKFVLPYNDCRFNFSRIYDAADDYTTIYFNHKFLARFVNATTLAVIPGTTEISFMAGCWYQLEGNANTNFSVSSRSKNEIGDFNGEGIYSASDTIDMWITDRQGRNVSTAAFGTPLTLHMALNAKGLMDYSNIAPKSCYAAPILGAKDPIPFVENYAWNRIIFDTVSEFQSIGRYNISYGTKSHTFYYFTYEMNFTAFAFDSSKSVESVNFACNFRLCIGRMNHGDCDRIEQSVAYYSTSWRAEPPDTELREAGVKAKMVGGASSDHSNMASLNVIR